MKIKKQIFILFLSLSASFLMPMFSLAQFVEKEGIEPSEETIETAQFFYKTIDVINALLALLFILSIVGFLIAGVKSVIAGGNETMLESSKKAAILSLIGFTLALVGYIVISVIKHFLT